MHIFIHVLGKKYLYVAKCLLILREARERQLDRHLDSTRAQLERHSNSEIEASRIVKVAQGDPH